MFLLICLYVGGCYPRGGSDVMAKELLTTIESFGGRVLIRAQVERILVENGRAVGVKMIGGQEIRSRKVVSGACYSATTKLLGEEVCRKVGVSLFRLA
jgi:all-trans-retinol 13,14-reductase